MHARPVGGAHAAGEHCEIGLEQHGDARPAQDVAVPLVADGAAAKRAHHTRARGEALADPVLQLAEGEPAALADKIVEAPAQLQIQLAVQIEKGPAQPLGQPCAQRGLAGADQAGQIDVRLSA